MSLSLMLSQQESTDMNGNLSSVKQLEKDVVKRRMKEFESMGEEERNAPTSPLACDDHRNWPIVKHSPSKPPIWGPSFESGSSWSPALHIVESPPKLLSVANGVSNDMPGKLPSALSPIIADRLSLFQGTPAHKGDSAISKTCARNIRSDNSVPSAYINNQDCKAENGKVTVLGDNFSNQLERKLTDPSKNCDNKVLPLVAGHSSLAEKNIFEGSAVKSLELVEATECLNPNVNTNSLSRNRPATTKPPLHPKPAVDSTTLSRSQSVSVPTSTSNDSAYIECEAKTMIQMNKSEIGNVSVPLEHRPVPSPRAKPELRSENGKNWPTTSPTMIVSPPPKPPRLLSIIEDKSVNKDQDNSSRQSDDYHFLSEAHSMVSVMGYPSNNNQSKPIGYPIVQSKPSISQSSASPLSPLIQSRLMELTQQLQPKPSDVANSSKPKLLKPLQYDGEYKQDAWEKKFIRAQPMAHDNASVMGRKKLNNPSYMYATVRRPDDIIFGRRALLNRHRSDDMLDRQTSDTPLSPGGVNSNNQEQIYHDPNSLLQAETGEIAKVAAAARNKRTVTFDLDGYAIPSTEDSTGNNLSETTSTNRTGRISTNHNNRNGSVNNHSEENLVKSKISNAYSVLRWNVLPRRGSQSDEDKESELDLEEHRKRLKHVTQVKQKTYEIVARYEMVKLMSDMRLFQYALIVGLEPEDPDSTEVRLSYKPYVKFCFPTQVSESDRFASNLCFPDADMWQPVMSYNGDLFSFVLTNAEAERKFGWCWRYLPPGIGPRLPEAVCIVSPMGELSLYEQLLKAVQECRAQSLDSAQELLQVAWARPFPAPNNEVYIRTVGPDFKKKLVTLTRPAESRLNNVAFNLLLSKLTVDVLLQVYAAVLLERKVIMCSKHLHTLTSCVFTIVALLYPFEWQHTFVTVLPSTLIDLVEAPTPYILGIHMSMVPLLAHRDLDEVLVVNLDSSTLLYKVGDENRIIPRRIMKALHTALDEPDDSMPMSCAISDSLRGRPISDSTVTEAFLRLFVETCGHYTEYICRQQNNERVFQRELFVKAVSARGIRMFLEWFTQTQMFEVFVTDKLKETSTAGLFEERIMEYRQEMIEVDASFSGNVKAVGKKIVGFFRDSGDRIKKTFQKNVYV